MLESAVLPDAVSPLDGTFGDARVAELHLLSWVDQQHEVILRPVPRSPWHDLLIALVSANLLTTFSYESARLEAAASGLGSSPKMDSPSGIAGESLLERAMVKARVRAVDHLYSGAGVSFRLTHQGRVRLSELKQALRFGRTREPFGILWDARHWEQDLLVALIDATAGAPLTVALMDMNGLKNLNDSRGHDAGDRGLRMYFQTISSAVADVGEAYRIGGDEVLAIMPSFDADKAAKRLEAGSRQLMRDSVAEEEIGHVLSISVGIVTEYSAARSPAEVRKAADEAQYRAKSQSRLRTPRPSVIAIGGRDSTLTIDADSANPRA